MARAATNAARRAAGDSAGGGGELIVAEDLHDLLGEMERHTNGFLDVFPHCGHAITSPRAAAVIVILVAPRGIAGLLRDRLGWTLFPIERKPPAQ